MSHQTVLHNNQTARHSAKTKSCFNKQTVPVKVNSVTSGRTTHSLTARTAKHSAGLQTQVGNCVKPITNVWDDDDDDDANGGGDDDDDGNNNNNNNNNNKAVNLSLCTPYGHIGNSSCRSPRIRTGTGCRRVVNYTSRPPHSRGKSPNMNS